jgi:hypothetical protein
MKTMRTYYMDAKVAEAFDRACEKMKQKKSQVIEELVKRYAEQVIRGPKK